VLSVWGSDVFDFPVASSFHRYLLRRNLTDADRVCSTSHVMARQVSHLTAGRVRPVVIPFGVETQRFAAKKREGFAECRRRLREQRDPLSEKLRLRIVGGGQQRAELERLAAQQKIAAVTQFVGPVIHDQVPNELNRLDIYVAVSRIWRSHY
jgi:hypothetical protein